MAKIKSNIRGLSDLQTIQQCNNIKTSMTGNANFATPTPTLTAFGTLITTAQTKLTTADTAQNAAKQATADKDVALDALRTAASQMAMYVDLTANGDEPKILSSGFAVRAAAVPTVIPPTVMNLFLTAGDVAGALDLSWDSEPSARNYEAQVTTDQNFVTGVNNLASISKSATSASGMASGTRVWARVRAVNAAQFLLKLWPTIPLNRQIIRQ